jgi:Stress responsive A/B Barrel Domain
MVRRYEGQDVIRHEVILRIKPELPMERIERTLRQACDCIAEIPGVQCVRMGVNKTAAYRHAMVAVDLEDETALRRFQRHALHMRAVRLISRMAESTAVGSYLVSSEHRR